MVKVIAHRGFSSRYPSNTLAAFQGAIDCGADFLELDIQMTSDKELVVVHDSDLSQITNDKVVVEKLSLKELHAYDAGSWFAPEFSGERIPTLVQVLDLTEGKIGLNIEIKPTKNPDIIGVFADTLNRRTCTSGVFVSSFDIDLLSKLKRRNPNISCAYAFLDNERLDQIIKINPKAKFDFKVTRKSLVGHIDRAAALGFDQINFRWSVLTPELVRYAHQHGLLVNLYVVDEQATMLHLVKLGVDGIITNCPNLLLDVLANKP